MIKVADKRTCNGCEACANICPTLAISMQPDEEGFLYPKVDATKCVQCGKCESVCPVINFERRRRETGTKCIYYKAYAFKGAPEEIRLRSSSGGAFYAFAARFIEEGGAVAGAAFDQNFKLNHELAWEREELLGLMGSKYLQSRIGMLYRKVRKQLDLGKKILFVGMSCQIEGLQAYLGREYPNLYCIDLICMGVPSPGVWEKYLSSYFKRGEIRQINFKDKTMGWHKFCVSIENRDGTRFLQPGFDNYYMESMFKRYSVRPSCFTCPFKCEGKRSDITIADCWGCEKYLPEMDDNKGLSMMIAHTAKGMGMIDWMRTRFETREFDYDNVLKFNPYYYRTVTPKAGRGVFMKIMNLHPRAAFGLMCRNPGKSLVSRTIKKLKRKL